VRAGDALALVHAASADDADAAVRAVAAAMPVGDEPAAVVPWLLDTARS